MSEPRRLQRYELERPGIVGLRPDLEDLVDVYALRAQSTAAERAAAKARVRERLPMGPDGSPELAAQKKMAQIGYDLVTWSRDESDPVKVLSDFLVQGYFPPLQLAGAALPLLECEFKRSYTFGEREKLNELILWLHDYLDYLG